MPTLTETIADPNKRRAVVDDGVAVIEAEVADKSGLSAGYLNHVVHGNRPVPANEVIERLAAAFDVVPEHFLEVRIRAITERSGR